MGVVVFCYHVQKHLCPFLVTTCGSHVVHAEEQCPQISIGSDCMHELVQCYVMGPALEHMLQADTSFLETVNGQCSCLCVHMKQEGCVIAVGSGHASAAASVSDRRSSLAGTAVKLCMAHSVLHQASWLHALTDYVQLS